MGDTISSSNDGDAISPFISPSPISNIAPQYIAQSIGINSSPVASPLASPNENPSPHILQDNGSDDVIILDGEDDNALPTPRQIRTVVDLVSNNGFLDPSKFKSKEPIDLTPFAESTEPISLPKFDNDDDEKMKCPVCLERWSANGSHRVCTLRCGHLFGLSCIRTWMASNRTAKRPSCPICHKTIFQNDIVCLFVGDVYALESAELDLFNERLKTAKLERDNAKRIAAELKKTLTQRDKHIKLLEEELEMFKKEAKKELTKPYPTRTAPPLKTRRVESPYFGRKPPNELENASSLSNIPSPIPNNQKDYLHFSQTINIPVRGARTAEFLRGDASIVVNTSQQFKQNYGLMKVSLLDPSLRETVWFHTDVIRDIKTKENKLLCASFDQFASVIDSRNLSKVVVFPVQTKAWSCAWSADENLCYVGCQNNMVKMFDIRAPDACVEVLRRDEFQQPCHSLSVLQSRIDGCVDTLLGGCMNGASVYVNMKESGLSTFQVLQPELHGKCISVSYDPISTLCLASYRNTKEYKKTSHHVFNIDLALENKPKIQETPFRVLYGNVEQPLMSRSTILSVFGGFPRVLAVANEGIRTTIWDTKNGQPLQTLPHAKILDVKGMINSDSLMKSGKRMRTAETGTDFLCTVDSSSLRLYATNPSQTKNIINE